MAVTDKDRRELYQRAADTFGESVAETLMELLPPQPSSELATRQDVLATATALRGEMAELRAELRGEMADLRADVNTQIAGLQRWAAGILAANGVALVVALLT